MTQTYRFTIDAIDTLMFRDGRPFNQSDAGAGQARSVFPPYPPTLVGAVRMMLARQLGYGRDMRWPINEIGDGVDWREDGQLGPLEFSAPLILKKDEPLFPAPLSLTRSKDGAIVRLRPGRARCCDLGRAVRLPEPEVLEPGLKLLEGHFVGQQALGHVLKGEKIDKSAFIGADRLWQTETRVGIGLDRENRVVNTGQLYSASHVRLRQDVSLGINVSGMRLEPRNSMQALAGEHRMASFRCTRQVIALPMAPSSFSKGRYFISLLSPALLDALPGPGERLCGLPGRVVSACLGKPVRIGGWDSQKRKPIPMREAIPSGSVWFLEADGQDDISAWNGKHLGRAKEWGFGQFV
ncbi:MAG: type III-B CRISPR module-associated protein Cmr3, partial [Afipia sp.]|nr:type III-B CRISPR module-associated protein Cmr3 [Afipia sp.]